MLTHVSLRHHPHFLEAVACRQIWARRPTAMGDAMAIAKAVPVPTPARGTPHHKRRMRAVPTLLAPGMRVVPIGRQDWEGDILLRLEHATCHRTVLAAFWVVDGDTSLLVLVTM